MFLLYHQIISIPCDNKCIPPTITDYSYSQSLGIIQLNFRLTIQEVLALVTAFEVIAQLGPLVPAAPPTHHCHHPLYTCSYMYYMQLLGQSAQSFAPDFLIKQSIIARFQRSLQQVVFFCILFYSFLKYNLYNCTTCTPCRCPTSSPASCSSKVKNLLESLLGMSRTWQKSQLMSCLKSHEETTPVVVAHLVLCSTFQYLQYKY